MHLRLVRFLVIICIIFIYVFTLNTAYSYRKIDNKNVIKDSHNSTKPINDEVAHLEVFDSKKEEVFANVRIPKININKNLYPIDSKKNTVDKNIQIIKESDMPDVVNGNLVLAGHNGASYVSFFRNLDKLNINDKIYIYYGGYKYQYSLSKIYDTPKDGNIEVHRDNNKTTITLITCKKNSKDTQVVYIGYLDSKELY